MEEFKGEVPGTMEDLLKLPEWRKPEMVLNAGFGRSDGIVVDTRRQSVWNVGISR